MTRPERLHVLMRFFFGPQRGQFRSWTEVRYARSVLDAGLSR